MGTTRPFKDVFVSIRSLMVVCKSWGSHKPIMFSLQNLPLNSTFLVEGVLENVPTFPSVSTVYPSFPHVFFGQHKKRPLPGRCAELAGKHLFGSLDQLFRPDGKLALRHGFPWHRWLSRMGKGVGDWGGLEALTSLGKPGW